MILFTREVLDMDDKMVYSYIDEIGKRLADPGLYGAASLMVGAGFSKNADCIGDKKNTPQIGLNFQKRCMKNYIHLKKTIKDEDGRSVRVKMF